MSQSHLFPYPLEPSPDALRELIAAAMERVVAHVASLPEQPSGYDGGGAELARSVREPLPEEGTAYGPLLDLLFERLVPASYNTAGPGYLGYIPGGGLVHAAIADLIADAVNRYVAVWQAAPGLAELEANVLRWFCGMVGYPEAARGYLSSGGSLANFTAVVTARRERLPEDFLAGTVYASDQVHHSVARAAALAGLPPANVRSVPSDGRFRLRLDLAAERITEDRRRGLRPFLLVASAGTTNTGAVDDLEAAVELAAREGLWLHVDAAYGGFFVLTERGRRAMAGLERADSITLDPHKGLFLPYGTGCLLVRDGEALRRAHATQAHYMRHLTASSEFTDFCQVSPELSRDFRGLRVWLPLKLVGAGAFRQALDEKLDLTQWAAAELSTVPGIEIVAEPQLSTLAFRLQPPGSEGEAGGAGEAPLSGDLDALNHRFLARINARQRVFLTGTDLACGFVLRICVLSFRTHREHLEACLEDVRAAAEETLAGRSQAPC